jgi:hypothetical protein
LKIKKETTLSITQEEFRKILIFWLEKNHGELHSWQLQNPWSEIPIEWRPMEKSWRITFEWAVDEW